MSPCGIPNYSSQPRIYVRLLIVNNIISRFGALSQYNYPTVDTYENHGSDLRDRIEKENPLSEYSGIQWSRVNIFKRPNRNERTMNGGPISLVNLLNPQETEIHQINEQEFSSVTLGSFQERLTRSYISKLRRVQVASMPWVDNRTNDQRLSQLPDTLGYIWDENHPPRGPPGWDPNVFWPWVNC